MFERLFSQLFRHAERREDAALKRDRRTINAKIRLLAQIGKAIMTAHAGGFRCFRRDRERHRLGRVGYGGR